MADISDLLKTVQGVTSQYQSNAPISEGFFSDLAGGAIEAARSGVADIPRILQKVTDALSNAATSEGAPSDRLIVFKQLADAIEPKDFEDQATLTRKIGRIFGGLVVAVPKYAAATAAMGPLGLGAAAAIPAMAGVDAATAWGRDEPPEQIGKAALGGAAFGAILGPLGSKLTRWPRVGAVGGGATALAALEGETKPEDLALTGLTMATLAAMGGRLPHQLKSKLNKLGYPNEFIKKLSIKDAREITRTNSKFVAPEPVIAPVTPTVVPPTSFADLRALLEKEGTSQIDAIKNSDLIYDKILLGRGFTEGQVASMSLPTKLAIGNSGHNASTVKVEPISGRITLTGKVPENTKTSEGSTITTERVPGYGMTVDDLVVDSTKLESLANTVKGVTSKIVPDELSKLQEGTYYTSEALREAGVKSDLSKLVKSGRLQQTKEGLWQLAEVAEEITKEVTPKVKPVANKEIVNQLKWKFGITDADAKKSAILLAERGIVIPSDATTLFESMPILSKGRKLYDHIINFEKDQALLKEKPELETERADKAAIQVANFKTKQLSFELTDIEKKIQKAESKLADLAKKEEFEKTAIDQSGFVKVQATIKDTKTALEQLTQEKDTILSKIEKKPVDHIDVEARLAGVKKELAKTDARLVELEPATTEQAIEMGKNLSRQEAMDLWKRYKAIGEAKTTEDAFKKQMLREQVEGYLGATGKKSLTPEAIEAKLIGKRRKVTVKELAKETLAGETKTPEEFIPTKEWQEVSKDVVLPAGLEIRMDMASGKNYARLLEKATITREVKTPEEINREQLIGRASVLWPNRRMDLALVSDVDLQRIITEKILPQKATITPSGKLVEIATGDRALAATLGIPVEEGIKVREGIEKDSPRTQEGLLRAAAEFVNAPYETVAALSDVNKQNVINTYLQYADKNIEKAIKVGEVIGKGEVEATRTYNEVVSKNSDTDVALAQLKRKHTEVDRKAKVAKASFRDGSIDKTDLDLLLNSKTEALKAIEQRRNELKKKTDAPLKDGESRLLVSVSTGENGGVIVVKKVSSNIDEFQLLTKAGQSPIPGDTGLHIAGRVRIEKGLDGRPIKIDFPATLDILQQEFFKEQFKNAVKAYYEKQGFGTPEGGGAKLRTGVDVDLLKEMTSRLKQKTVDIYQGFAARQGTNRRISREEMPSVMRDIMDAEKLRISEAELAAMHAESMSKGITKMPTGWNVPGVGTVGPGAPTPMVPGAVAPGAPTPTTVGAPGGIPKGDVPMVKATDILGQSMANANPDIRQLAEKSVLNEIRKRNLKDKLVYGDDSRLNAIFKKINEQPNAKELREQLSDSFMRDTVLTNPLLLEAKNNIRSFLDMFGDANDLRERGFYVNKYFPLIADMDNTYIKIKGMFANIENNSQYDKDNNPRGLPSRYIEAGKSALSNEEFLELKTIFAKNRTWTELSNVEKNRVRYNVLQFEGIYDQWAFLPSDIMEKTNKKTFNPHLQERKGGQLLSYKHDSQEVLKQYLYTMINKESDRIFKQEVMPLINQYPRGDIRGSVRWYMEKQVKQALGTRTEGARWLSQEVERLNNVIGQEVLNPNFPTVLAGRLSGQVARGALGVDTALRNILQSTQTLVNEGPGKFAKGLHSYFEYLKGKGDPNVKKMFDLLLGAEEYYEDVGPTQKTLKARWQKAETMPGKAGAFYNWIGDMALSPMRATEHFNKFLAFQTALSEAGAKGWSFEKGVRLGLLKSMEMVPDLEIPNAYFNAFKSVIQSQYGYSKTMRNPLTRGPLAKVSTIFWSYPANTVQFMARGLMDGIKGGDISKTARFGLYVGFQLSIAAVMAQLGIDVASIFGFGLMPIRLLSVPWDVLKGSYNATFGGTAGDRSSGVDDLLNSLGILTIPQFRYGKKVLKTVIDLERGYKAAGTRELETMETSPFHAIMDLTGFPFVGSRKTYDLVQELRDQAYEYGKDKQALVLRGIKAMEKGKMADVQKVFADAKKQNVVLTYSELSKYFKINQTKTYLQSNLERLPKHLRPAMQKKVKELEEQLMPHRFGKAENFIEGRSMWSSSSQLAQQEEE